MSPSKKNKSTEPLADDLDREARRKRQNEEFSKTMRRLQGKEPALPAKVEYGKPRVSLKLHTH
jgi:hypothetical protein